MPFVIKSAPEHDQKRMNEILEGVEGQISIIDGILVRGNTQMEHNTLEYYSQSSTEETQRSRSYSKPRKNAISPRKKSSSLDIFSTKKESSQAHRKQSRFEPWTHPRMRVICADLFAWLISLEDLSPTWRRKHNRLGIFSVRRKTFLGKSPTS